MAQLRDAKTSECILEGTPAELAIAARAHGGKAATVGPGEDLPADVELLFDDVGFGFDPDALLEARELELNGLRAVAAGDGGDLEGDQARELKARAAAKLERMEATDARAGDLAAEAGRRLEQARARLEE